MLGRRPDGRTIDPPAPFAMLPAQFEQSGSRGLVGVHSLLRRVAVAALTAGLGLGSVAAGVTLAGVPPPPSAVADSFSVDEDTALVVEAPGPLANDNPGAASCIPTFDDTALIGELDLQPSGAFTYTPPDDFHGETSFVYGVQAEGLPDCAGPADSEATVTLIVNAVNDAPTAKADSFQALPDRTLNVAAPGILLNDGDIDGDFRWSP